MANSEVTVDLENRAMPNRKSDGGRPSALQEHGKHRPCMEVILMYNRVFLTILIALSFVLLMPDLLKSECYGEYIEDLIEIEVIDHKVIAFRDGKDPLSFQLRLTEKILWKGSKGNLGIVLTDTRFLAISMTSEGWHETSLRMNEAAKVNIELSMNIALIVTSERVIGFDCTTNNFVEQRLRLEKLLANEANMYVAVVVSTDRAFGLAMGKNMFVEIPFEMNERFVSLVIQSRLATVRTTNRVLSFQASDSSWNEVDLPLAQEGYSQNIIEALSKNPKLIQPKLILDDFVKGKRWAEVIVNLAEPMGFKHGDHEALKEAVWSVQGKVINRLDENVVVTDRFMYVFGFAAEVTLTGLQELIKMGEVVSINKDMKLKIHDTKPQTLSSEHWGGPPKSLGVRPTQAMGR